MIYSHEPGHGLQAMKNIMRIRIFSRAEHDERFVVKWVLAPN